MRWQMMMLVAAACGSNAAEVTPKPLWSFDPQVYYDGRDFAENSAFSHDLAVIAKVPSGPNDGLGVVALAPRTGAKVWQKSERGWLLHPPQATTPLYLAVLDDDPKGGQGYSRMLRLDPATGAVLSTIKLARDPGNDFYPRILWSPQGAIVLSGYHGETASAFDWTTGAQLWSTNVGNDASKWPSAVIGDRLYIAGETVRVLSLTDGKQLAEIATGCCDPHVTPHVVASPDGRHVFVPGGIDDSVEIDAQLATRHVPGEIRAASNAYYAVVRTADHPIVQNVEVFAYGRPDPVAVLAPRDTKDFFAALALTDDHVFYFHNADSTFSQQDLTTGKIQRIDHITPHLVISPDATGTADAYMGTPPIIARPYLFTQEWGVHGFQIAER